MCFSVEGSFGSAAIVGGIGVATIPKIRRKRDLLLGLLPLMFGAHQALEGGVWLGLEGRLPSVIERWCVWGYVLFAQAILLVIVPWAFWLSEPASSHRRQLVPLAIGGTLACGYAIRVLAGSSITARIHGHGIEYWDALSTSWWFVVLYVAITCMPPLLSSYPWMFAFGLANLTAVLAVGLIKLTEFTSAWCTVAALISFLVYLHFRRLRELEEKGLLPSSFDVA